MITGNPNYFNLYATKGHNHDDLYSVKSHNHDDLYSVKSHNHDSKYYSKNIGTVSNFNDCLHEGGYFVGAGSEGIPNAPYSGDTYGKLLVFVSPGDTHNNYNNWIWQIYLDTFGNIYYRLKVNGGNWWKWTLLHTVYSSYSDKSSYEIEVLTNRIETLEQTVNQLLDKVNSDL